MSAARLDAPADVIYVAIANFAGDGGKKLQFNKGDRMTLLRESSADWFKVKMHNDGRSGMVPANHIKRAPATPGSPPLTAAAKRASLPSRRSSTRLGEPEPAPPGPADEPALRRRGSRRSSLLPSQRSSQAYSSQFDPLPPDPDELPPLPMLPPAPLPAAPSPSMKELRRMVVVGDFQGKGKKITLHAGDEVVVLNETDVNWWEVRAADGRTGLAPVNYLQPVAPVRFRAVHAYVGRGGKQISFSKGEELTLVERKNANWIEVANSNGMRGLAPSNYLEEFDPDGDDVNVMMRAIADFTGSGLKVSLTSGEEVTLLRRKSTDWYEVRKSDGRKGLAPSSYLEEFVPVPVHFRVVAEYRGVGGKLSLKFGERLTLVKRVTGDWYEVTKDNGERGLAPSNYIEEYDGGDGSADKFVRAIADYVGRGGQVSFSSSEVMTVCKKLSADWFEVKRVSGERGLCPRSYVEDCTVTYVAIADYQGPPGQLSLSKGEDLVLVRRRNKDWCEVRKRSGTTGLAPVSYLEEKLVEHSAPAPSTPFVRPTLLDVTPAMRTSSLGLLPSADDRARIPVERWTELHVLSWLQSLPPPAASFMDHFRRNDINGETLLTLTESDLEKIGVDSLRARRDVFQAIQRLRAGTPAAAPARKTPLPTTDPIFRFLF